MERRGIFSERCVAMLEAGSPATHIAPASAPDEVPQTASTSSPAASTALKNPAWRAKAKKPLERTRSMPTWASITAASAPLAGLPLA
jgi:hypothetical protein